MARKLDSGRIEFGLQQRQPDNTWGDRQLPRVRFFPTTATVNRWLASSTLTLTTPQPATPTRCRRIHRAVLRRHRRQGPPFVRRVRTDGTITCWGANFAVRAGDRAPTGNTPPSAAGGARIRAGCAPTAPSPAGAGTTTDRAGPDPAPASGQFSAVTAGGFHSCGLRTNGTITCWGRNNDSGQATAPSGQFSAVTAGGVAFVRAAHRRHHHLLGMERLPGRRPRPDGQYSAVTAGAWHSCGLRTDGTITCWGAEHDGEGAYSGQATAPGRAVLRRHRRHWPFVRAAHRRHHHLLGRQRLLGRQLRRPGDRARRAILRRQRRQRVPFVRAAHRRHHHLLGV